MLGEHRFGNSIRLVTLLRHMSFSRGRCVPSPMNGVLRLIFVIVAALRRRPLPNTGVAGSLGINAHQRLSPIFSGRFQRELQLYARLPGDETNRKK